MRKVSLLIAFAVSLSLHLAAFVFLAGSAYSNKIPSGRAAGLSNAVLIVTITKPEMHIQPAVTPSNDLTSEAPRNPEPSNAMRPPGKGILPSPALALQERYFSVSELDVIPRIQQDIELYPEELQHFKKGGKVVLSLWINETGQVEKVELVSSALPAIFSEVATRNFLQASFLPGKKNNLAVKSKVEAVLVFPSHEPGN